MINSNMVPGAGCLIATLVLALVGLAAIALGAWWLISHIDVQWATP